MPGLFAASQIEGPVDGALKFMATHIMYLPHAMLFPKLAEQLFALIHCNISVILNLSTFQNRSVQKLRAPDTQTLKVILGRTHS